MRIPTAVLIGAATLAAAAAAPADSQRTPPPAAYVEECGSCHVAFPARMLDAASWRAVLAGLGEHFGVDASLDAEALEPIRVHLEREARRRPTAAPDGTPLLRIGETRWFRHEHDEVPSRFWKEPYAVKPADCGACHRRAEEGRYGEGSLRLPKPEEIRRPQPGGAR